MWKLACNDECCSFSHPSSPFPHFFPFLLTSTATATLTFSQDFDYVSYLEKCMAEDITRIVDVSVTTWSLTCGTLLLNFVVSSSVFAGDKTASHPFESTMLFVLLGWFMLAVMVFLQFRCHSIESEVRWPVPGFRLHCSSAAWVHDCILLWGAAWFCLSGSAGTDRCERCNASPRCHASLSSRPVPDCPSLRNKPSDSLPTAPRRSPPRTAALGTARTHHPPARHVCRSF